jgi:hypothetical protein
MDASKRYAAEADIFERCVADFAAKPGKPISNPLAIIENHRIAESRRNRKLVAARVNGAITDFNEYGSGCAG